MADDGRARTRVRDEALLRTVAHRLGSLTLVDTGSVFPQEKPDAVVAQLDRQYYPEGFERVFIELRAYTNGDFHVSYVEDYLGKVRGCRWDRHDQEHSTRDHFHLFTPIGSPHVHDRVFPVDETTTLETVALPWVDERLGRIWEETR